MTVFKSASTLFVSFALLGGSQVQAIWSYPVDKPEKPHITHVVQLVNPTLSQIQAAINPNTRIDVSGTVTVPWGQRLTIDADDVKVNFANANQIQWSGNDVWGGFVEVNNSRVELLNLKMTVVGNGRCRGMVIHSPATDVRIAKCEFKNVADGLIADGVWARLSIEQTKFLNCSDWTSSSTMEGGYGMFIEDDDEWEDHLRLDDVTITLANSSGQHGLRICKVQHLLIEDSWIGANGKRSLWVYGIDTATIRRSTFDKGSVMFNLKPFETMTERPVQHVRMYNCTIDHRSIMVPLELYCGKGTRDVRFHDMDMNSTTANRAMTIGYRSDDLSQNIRWFDGSNTFNGQTIWNYQSCQINDWTDQELEDLTICAIDDPRDD
jgi:hypothetical protein